jgi:hypothetical protein
MIDLGRTGSKLLTVAGTLDFMCQEVEAADPVTFTTKDSHLVSNKIHRYCNSFNLYDPFFGFA